MASGDPVPEAVFILKADQLIEKLHLLAEAINDARIAVMADAFQQRAVLQQLVVRADTAIDEAKRANEEANQLETARIKRVPLRHGRTDDGTL
jgi:predicted transcriptional regulator